MKAFSLIEILITISLILAIMMSIFIYDKIKFNKAIDDIFNDVFYSYSIFKETTAYENNIEYSGKESEFVLKSKFPPLKNEKSEHAAIWYGHMYFKTELGIVLIQANSTGKIHKDQLVYHIVLKDKNKESACIRLTKRFINNSMLDQNLSFINNQGMTIEKIKKDKVNLSEVCENKDKNKDISINLVLIN